MRRRKLRWLVVAGLAVLLVGAVAFMAWPRPDRITEANADRIKKGMSLAEVEAILGPPGDYRSGPTEPDSPSPFGPFGPSVSPEYRTWQGDRGTIWVWLNGYGDPAIVGDDRGDPNGVADVDFGEAQRIEQGPLDNLLWRAKRQWRKWFPEK